LNPNTRFNVIKHYYSIKRQWINLFNIRDHSSILDVGCGSGELGRSLKVRFNSIVHGIEITVQNFEIAQQVLDRVVLGDFEQCEVNFGVSYDYIIFSDSLEHMVDTQRALLRARELLGKDGELLMSIPNVRNFRVLFPLIFRDQFKYENEGILDRTHLRFFTKKSIINELVDAGFKAVDYFYELPLSSKVGKLNVITFGMFRGFLTSHFYIRAVKADL